jgi:hypothetical protein
MTMTRRHLLLLLPAGVRLERAARQKLQMAGPAGAAVIKTPTRLESVRRQLQRRLQQPLLALVLLALGMCRLRLGMAGAVRWWPVMMGGGMLAPVLLMMTAGACRPNPRPLTHTSQTQHMQHQKQQQQQQILHRAQQTPNRLQLQGG